MIVKNGELDYTFNKVIESGVYHFDIVLRDCDSLDNHIVGWIIINVKSDNYVAKTSKCLESLITNNDLEEFIKKMINATNKLDKTIYNSIRGNVDD